MGRMDESMANLAISPECRANLTHSWSQKLPLQREFRFAQHPHKQHPPVLLVLLPFGGEVLTLELIFSLF